jgi:protein SCO1/2
MIGAGRAIARSLSMATTILVTLVACNTGSEAARATEDDTPSPGTDAAARYRGVVLQSGPRPDFTLSDVDGKAFSFREETEGQLALLFFGYTNCPDICPVHMAGIASVLRDLPWEIGDRIRVVFVSTDPERDTPERMREWLSGFDPRFIGLRGDMEAVNRIQAELALPPSIRGAVPPDGENGGGYEVGHAAQVLVFGSGGLRLAYPFGTRQADWKHDLPLLVSELQASHEPPARAGASRARSGSD